MIDKQSAGDPTIKELKQLVEGGASEDAGDWPRGLTEYFMKHVYYTVIGNTVIGNTVIGNTVLIDGRVIVPGGLRSQMLSALHRSHGGIEGIRALAREAMFWPTSVRRAGGSPAARRLGRTSSPRMAHRSTKAPSPGSSSPGLESSTGWPAPTTPTPTS